MITFDNISAMSVMSAQGDVNFPLLLPPLILAIAILFIFFVFLARIVKCGSNEVLVLTGGFKKFIYINATGNQIRRGYRLVQSGASFVFPMIQKVDRLSLEVMSFDKVTSGVMSRDDGIYDIESNIQVKVKSDERSIVSAVEAFLSRETDEVGDMVNRSVEGHVRSVFGSLTNDEIKSQRAEIPLKIRKLTQDDLLMMGLDVVSYSILDIGEDRGDFRHIEDQGL